MKRNFKMGSMEKKNLNSSQHCWNDLKMIDDEWQNLEDERSNNESKVLKNANFSNLLIKSKTDILNDNLSKEVIKFDETKKIVDCSISKEMLESDSSFKLDLKNLFSWTNLFSKKCNKSDQSFESKLLENQESKNNFKKIFETNKKVVDESSYLNSSQDQSKDIPNVSKSKKLSTTKNYIDNDVDVPVDLSVEKKNTVNEIESNHLKKNRASFSKSNVAEKCQNLATSISNDDETKVKNIKLTQFERLSLIADYIDQTTNSSDSDNEISERKDKENLNESDNSFAFNIFSDDNKKPLYSKKHFLSSNQDSYESINLLNCDELFLNEFEYINERAIESTKTRPSFCKSERNFSTCRIERPICTTPINIAPLEAFLSSSTSPDSNLEKIKLSLPGEQFVNPFKSKNRKSDSQSWLNFCEKALITPKNDRKQRLTKKDAISSSLDAFSPTKDPFSQISSNPVASNNLEDSWSTFLDNFDPTTHHISELDND